MPGYVMITGAAGGLGKALAAEYAERGHPLFLTDVSAEQLESFRKGLERLTEVDVVSYACDLRDDAAVEAMWSWIGKNGFVFDGLLNVAGISHLGRFDALDVGSVLDILKINVEALVGMSRRILDHRAPGSVLRIVNISSLGCFSPLPHKTTYAASKRFVLDFSVAMNEEMREEDVRVMAVCPAGMPTSPANVRSVNDGHGIMGFLTEKNVGWVARRIYEQSSVGRVVYIPGRLNLVLGWLSRITPEKTKARVLRRHWRRALDLARN